MKNKTYISFFLKITIMIIFHFFFFKNCNYVLYQITLKNRKLFRGLEPSNYFMLLGYVAIKYTIDWKAGF